MITPGGLGQEMSRPAQKARAKSRSCSTSVGIFEVYCPHPPLRSVARLLGYLISPSNPVTTQPSNLFAGFLDLLKHSHEVASQDFLDVGFRQAALEKTGGDRRECRCVLQVVRKRRH